MKVHTSEQINQLSAYIAERGAEPHHYELDDYNVDYFVTDIPSSAFPLAVASAFPSISSKHPRHPGQIIISPDVPEAQQGLWALHEKLDYTKFGHSAVGRCFNSEAIILTALTQNHQLPLSREYAAARVKFFERLGEYMLTNKEEKRAASQFRRTDKAIFDQAQLVHLNWLNAWSYAA